MFTARLRPLACLALGLAASQAALAQTSAQRLNDRTLAATCAACHGTDGHTTAGSPLPALAGMPKPYMDAQMKSFRDGTRPATVMHQLAKGLTDEQLDRLSTYFAAQAR